MEQSYIDNFKKGLAKYVPAEAVNPLFDFMAEHKVHLHITRERYSKLGDYRWPQQGHSFHEISVNGNLNPYHFLLVLLHEMAHLDTWQQYKNSIQPHGHEWQANYARLINLYLPLFPTDVSVLLQRYTARIPLSRTIEKQIDSQLRHYNPDYTPSQDITLNDLTPGTRFHIASRPDHHFQALEKRRTRWICLNLADGKKYLVSGTAVVVTE